MHHLFRLNKGKGILVILYCIVSLLGTAMVVGALNRNIGGIFSQIDFYTTAGIAFLFTSIWTYLTKDDYYKDREGYRKKMDTVNSFIFIKMKIWAIIFSCAALFFFGNLALHYFKQQTF
ncbi:MAG: hypothetical protein ABIY62_10390 [Ginsengibacter sp.]